MSYFRDRLKSLLVVLTLSFAAITVSAKDVLYVKSGGSGDGLSWSKAMGNIQQAVDSAAKIGADVWVAAGTYYGDTASSSVVTLAPGVNLYGGFAGGEITLADRDTAKNPTILDGEGKYRLIYQEDNFADSSSVIVAGFTIQNGYSKNGAGVYLKKNTTLDQCIIRNCVASEGYVIYANANVKNSLIINNGYSAKSSDQYGIISLTGGSIDNCIVRHNKVNMSHVIKCASNVTVSNTLFEDLNCYTSAAFDFTKTTVSDCKFIDIYNKKAWDGLMDLYQTTFNRCLVKNCNSEGSVMKLRNSSVISNSIVCKCKSSTGNFLNNNVLDLNGASKIINCTIVDNVSFNGHAVYIYTDDKIINSIIVSNSPNLSSKGIVSYSLIEGGFNGVGNINGGINAAAFVDAENGDYSLQKRSVCINNGTDVSETLDFLGNERKQNLITDIGAIESPYMSNIPVDSIIYVKEGSNGFGSSWEDALGDINLAVTLASTTGKRHQIWVAAGTYYGDTTAAAALFLAPGVSLYGGFAGGETSLSERDAEKNITVIDGKKERKCMLQNSDFVDSMAVVVDGFSLMNGRSSGGCCADIKKNITVSNCIIKNTYGNIATAIMASNSVIRKCKFLNNEVHQLTANGGIVDSCIFSSPNVKGEGKCRVSLVGARMTNCLFFDNPAENGIINASGKSIVANCKIYRNTTTFNPLIDLNASTMVNCLIYDNVANNKKNIVIIRNNSDLINSTVASNKTTNVSTITGTSINKSTPYGVISNSIIYGNKMTTEVKPQVEKSDLLQMRYCASDDDLNGENCIKLAKANSGSDSTQNYVCFVNAVGGDYRLHATSSCIDKGLDSVCTLKTDVDGNARIYGKAIDLGAIEFDGKYVPMPDYNQTVCYNGKTIEATFDSTISRIEWQIIDKGNVSGFGKTSGSGVSIPSMQLTTTKKDIDVLSLKVIPYDSDGEAGVPFSYTYYVYPDLSKQTLTFSNPEESYVLNDKNTWMTISWNKVSVPIVVDHYDLYVWKLGQDMPSSPIASLINGYYREFNNLDNHTTYLYMVKAITSCDTVSSAIDTFRIDIPARLAISGSNVCELGTKLNSTTSSSRFVTGFELKDSISYSITGKDSADFSVSFSKNWNPLTGGYFDVNYYPTDGDKATSSATLTFMSGEHKVELALKGILANYYVFDAVVENDVYKAGDTILIKGYVSDAYGNPYEGRDLKITLRKGDYDIKIYEAVSDSMGEISFEYVPSIYESGLYSVLVGLSGETSVKILDEFNIPGISCSIGSSQWLVQKGDTIRGTITVTNRSNVEVRNINVRTLTLADGCKVVFDSINVLNGLESKKINYYVVGESITEGKNYLPSTFRVESGDGLTAGFTSYFYCEEPYGQIKVLPANIKEYVSKQNAKYVELLLCNTGIGETGRVSVSLPNGFDGMSMPAGTEIESIKPGDTVKATLKLAYYEGAKLNTPISGSIGINCENGKSTSVGFAIEYTSSMVGTVIADVVDEYFYNSTSKKHLEGATVEIKNPFNSQVIASATTDSTGIVRFDSIPEGDYLMVVNADKHSSYKESITVQAGQDLRKLVFVSYQAVSYTWNVERVDIEDKYEMTMKTEFETNVPAPVVTAEFPNGVPSRESFSLGEKKIVYMVIKNHGLIAAKDVRISVQEMIHFKFTPELDHIDSLAAKSSVVVPVTIERLNIPIFPYSPIDGTDFGGIGNIDYGTDCGIFHIMYTYWCGKLISKYNTVMCWKSKMPYPSLPIVERDFGNVDGNVHFDIISIKEKSCDTLACLKESRVNMAKCLMDYIIENWVSGFANGKGKPIQYDYLLESLKNDTIGFVFRNSTTIIGAVPYNADIPNSCYELLCQMISCEHGDTPVDCGYYIHDRNSYAKSRTTQHKSFYDIASSYLMAWHDLLELSTYEIHRSNMIAEYTGATAAIMRTSGYRDFLEVVIDSYILKKPIDKSKIYTIPVTDLSLTDMLKMADRWNETLEAWRNNVYSPNATYPDIVDKTVIDNCINAIINFYHYLEFRGYVNLLDLTIFINEEMVKYNQKKNVCAKVKLQMSQTMTMTREAFDGTLVVTNGQETLDMDNFKIALEIRDEKGNLANDLFQINTQSLKGIDAVDGSASILAGEEATAVFRFIPERGAALKTPVKYSFGGKIIYTEAGDTISMDLNPVTLTVNPSPDLQIDYFMQRNILGDDALTEDRVEPSVPAAFGVRIDNQGYGVAKNVKLESAKPTVVDNEKGLLIDFDIIGSSLNGKDCNLGSQNIDFGNIEGQTAKTGVWWMTSSLLGHFTKYEANVVHANSFGNSALSLVKNVAVHELIKTVDAYATKEDGIVDFLVNDDKDAKDTPDAIYYSNGGKDTVVAAKESKLSKNRLTSADSVIKLTVLPSKSGWNYAQMADPGSNYEIQKVVRLKDGVEIPLSNVWTTFVTIPDGNEPIYENRLHFLDNIATLDETDYNIYYNAVDVPVVPDTIVPVVPDTIVPVVPDTIVPVVPDTIVPVAPDTIVPVVPDTIVPVVPDTILPVVPDTIVPVVPDTILPVVPDTIVPVVPDTIVPVVPDTIVPVVPDTIVPVVPDTTITDSTGGSGNIITLVDDVMNEEFIVYACDNCIYIKSSKDGVVDVYDITSRLVVKNANYYAGVSKVAILPKGIYIVKGEKVIVR